MKCDELKSLKNIGLSFDTTTLHKQVIAEDSEGKCYGFDSWEEIYLKSDVDSAIAELKAENERLKAKIAEKDEEIESLKASHYTEMVDAGMREHKLKRALWLARASEAKKEVNYWTCQDESSYAIVDFNIRGETIVSYKSPHHRPYKWILIWENVERKCRAKAEQYK